MKSIVIFSVFCFVAAATAYSVDDDKRDFDECIRDLGVDNPERYYNFDLDAFLYQPTDEATCLLTCSLRKQAEARGSSLHKFLLEFVDLLYKISSKRSVSQETAVSKINDCFEQEQEECEIGKCITYGLSKIIYNKTVFNNEDEE